MPQNVKVVWDHGTDELPCAWSLVEQAHTQLLHGPGPCRKVHLSPVKSAEERNQRSQHRMTADPKQWEETTSRQERSVKHKDKTLATEFLRNVKSYTRYLVILHCPPGPVSRAIQLPTTAPPPSLLPCSDRNKRKSGCRRGEKTIIYSQIQAVDLRMGMGRNLGSLSSE